ncbi:MAG: hypothetical protein DHS20C02_03580 [Micavibrio sp.]|nr:MAG: hypothetical protein DHS20C02_03580 [Micavibrio sp.]
MSKHNAYHKESGNAVVIVLVVLVIAAVGGLAYLSGQMGGKDKDGAAASQVASVQQANPGAQAAAAGEQPEPLNVKPGNPVVAKLNGDDITRVDVFNFIQQLPPNVRQQPVQQLFPLAQDQVITARIIEAKTKGVKLDNDPEVKKQLAAAKEQIVRAAYINNAVTKKLTDERLKTAYDQYVKQFPDIDEVKARHILVEDEAKAKEIIAKLDAGGSFEELAKEHSTDGTAANGGDLGYFSKNDNLVPEFLEAAFQLKVGELSKKPAKTQFGYHIIKIEEQRKRPPADFETAKPFLEGELRRVVLNEVIEEWRKDMKIERFDINGDAIEPAAGGDAAAPAK